MEDKKRRIVAVELDDDLEALLKERMEYLQEKRPDCKVTISMALRHAIQQTSYKKRGKKNSEDDE